MHAPFAIRAVCLVAATLFAALGTAPAHAGEVAAGVRKSTKYVGEPFGVFVRAEGFDEDPAPTCTPGDVPDGVTLDLEQVVPSASTSVEIFNGVRKQRRTVSFTFQFRAVASKPGRILFAPFTVKQGVESATTRAVNVVIEEVKIDPDIKIELTMPKGPFAPGEQVPVTITWTAVGAPDELIDPTIHSDFLDRFRFEDNIAKRRPALYISTTKGRIPLRADRSRVTLNGKPATSWSAVRIWRVETAGTYSFKPITAILPRVVTWRRTFMGREPGETRRVRTQGKPLEIVVAPLPDAGKPASFAGAIGRGFTIETSADRTVVRVGDPIRLRIALRGDGTLDLAGMPRLTEGGGLDPQDFTQSEALTTGTIENDTKVFNVTVRVARDGVSSIPPITYSWWNPTRKAYETAQSSPIALQVGEAEVVSAGDVISAGSNTTTGTHQNAEAPEAGRVSMASGADLALVEDVTRLRRKPGSPWSTWAFYGLSALAVLGIVLARKRANVDPAIRAQSAAATQAERSIRAAAKQPAAEGAKTATAALRALRAAYPQHPQPASWERVLGALDAIAYRPASESGGLPQTLVDDACAAAREMSS